MALSRMTLEVKSANRRRSSILFSKLSEAGLSDVLNASLLETSSQTDENLNIEQTLSDLDFYYGLGEFKVYLHRRNLPRENARVT